MSTQTNTSGIRLAGKRDPRGTSLVDSGQTSCPTLDQLQKSHIRKVLELTGGKVSGQGGAAQILGLKPTTLESRIRKLGIERKKGSGFYG